ncbi:MAG: TonB-dependent receptor [Acidobacteria bacterium]|nr:TonB-dependent receptor [Acidobacteriota bacterium]
MKRISIRAIVALFIFVVPVLAQQDRGSIRGRLETATGQPITRAEVSIVETSVSTRTDSAGTFALINLAPGTYTLLIESNRFGSHARSVDVVAGEETETVITIDVGVHTEEIVVSASPDARTSSEVYQPIAVLNDQDLLERSEASLGETLNSEPGVSSTYFGPGSSRPVIRGLGGDRIRILEDGIGGGDASNISPDHAVTSDPLSAERIEIVRGPATLLYGSAAVGGIVNVFDGSIPDTLPGEKVTGTVDLIAGTVADETTGSIRLEGGAGAIAWHVDYLNRQTGDYEIPGPAEAEHEEEEHEGEEHEEEEHEGFLENSSLDTETGTVGASWIFNRGFAGVAVSRFETNYGIPGHAHGHEDEEGEDGDHEEEEGVRVDMNQTKIDFRSRIDVGGFIRNVKVRAGTTDYEHDELEGEEIGTHFENDGWEARVEAAHRDIGPFRGAFGAQVSRRDFVAVGEEAFVPPNETDMNALFVFEEMERGDWNFQAGARWEQQDVSTPGAELPDRSFDGVSASVGALWNAADTPWSVALSVARTERLPTAEELYSNGPHVATSSFEIGDPLLNKETALSGDLTFRARADRFEGEITIFRTEFSDFIYLQPTGLEEDELPVFTYLQDDADFHGVELIGHYDFLHWDPHHVELEVGGDWVEGSLEDGRNLPRIAPMRVFTALLYEAERLFGRFEVRHVFDQDDVAELEESTDGYTFLNANLGYRFIVAETSHMIMLRGRNLTDELARSHVSPLKDVAPLPGRDVSLAYRIIF